MNHFCVLISMFFVPSAIAEFTVSTSAPVEAGSDSLHLTVVAEPVIHQVRQSCVGLF